MRCLRRDGQPGTGAGDELLSTDLEADRAAEDLEPLLLLRVHVCGCDEAARLHVRLDHHCLAADARAAGIERLHAFVAAENTASRALMRRAAVRVSVA